MKKTKKALLAALACSAALAGAVGLAACSGGKDTHDHKWGSWTVSTQPTNEATGKATRACTGEGTCDAKATEKEATLPVLTSTDYAVTNDTATCQAAGTGTYTYNKNGVNVSFTAATPVNASNHTDTCGHNQTTPPTPTGHSHVWSEWTVNESAKQGYAGEATRTCTGAGECDADESLTVVTIPSVLWGDEYTYADPVVKTEATCQTEGVKTYTYTDTAKGISISFDVVGALGGHVIEGNECSVCHLSVVTAALGEEVTINATSEEAVILAFTAEKAGRYRFTCTEGNDVDINNNTVDFPTQDDLAAGETVTYNIKSRLDLENPDQATSATYKFKVVAVSVLKAEYDAEDNLVGSATVNVGGGKTAVLEVVGKPGFDGTLTYTGSNSLTFTWSYYSYEVGQVVEDSFTLSEAEPTKVLGFSIGAVSYRYTVSSDAEAAIDEELSLTLEEQQEDLQILPSEYSPKDFEGVDYGGKTYYVEIGDGGTYTVTVRGEDALAGKVYFEVRSDADDAESVLEANADGSYTFASDTTYYILIAANAPEDIVSGLVTVAEYVALPAAELNVEVSGYSGEVYTIELEAGTYQVMVDGSAVSIDYDDMDATIVFSTTDPNDYNGGEYVMGNGNVLTVTAATAGTYYIQLFGDETFKVVPYTPAA
ncbi:MAG: hypothetical protein K2I17_02310 [Clostridia bacterium]|nr:hypothetical protein [Clostridia bacterium]